MPSSRQLFILRTTHLAKDQTSIGCFMISIIVRLNHVIHRFNGKLSRWLSAGYPGSRVKTRSRAPCRDESSQSSADWFNTRYFSSCSSCYHGRKNRDKTPLRSCEPGTGSDKSNVSENVNRRKTDWGWTNEMRDGVYLWSEIKDELWEERAWQPFPISGIIISILSWGRRERASINYSYHSDNANTSQNNNYTHNIPGDLCCKYGDLYRTAIYNWQFVRTKFFWSLEFWCGQSNENVNVWLLWVSPLIRDDQGKCHHHCDPEQPSARGEVMIFM